MSKKEPKKSEDPWTMRKNVKLHLLLFVTWGLNSGFAHSSKYSTTEMPHLSQAWFDCLLGKSIEK